MIPLIEVGSILEFKDTKSNKFYDGVVWRVIKEGPDSYTLIVRYVDRLRDDYGGLIV